jgi:isoquinoline 1-oxidoreductase alpha subunit
VEAVANRHITTIEGLATPAGAALQRAWETEQVPQCGYCQSGQIMQAATLLEQNPQPSDADIVEYMDGHFFGCMAYPRLSVQLPLPLSCQWRLVFWRQVSTVWVSSIRFP